MAFKEEVKDAARGRWPDLLTEVGGIHRDLLDGKHHQCPRCGGKDRFRLIDEDEGAVLCNKCFSEKNGDGISAIQWMRGCSFSDALSLVGAAVGVKKKGRRRKTPDEVLCFEDWVQSRADWCSAKGISQDAVLAEGGRMATWRDYGVISIPILGTTADSKPRGYVIVNRRGGELQTRSGAAKILVTEGSKTGWLGKASLARLETAVVVWKVEGVTDMLSLAGAIPEADRPKHAVLTNPFGSTENPKANLVEVFRGKLAVVVHDPDDAGELGATKWAKAIAQVAQEVRIVKLPGGLDLRDWFGQGGDFDQLRRLARAATAVATPAKPAPPGGQISDVHRSSQPAEVDASEIDEEDDDNVRLAQMFLKQRARRFAIHEGAPHWWFEGRWRTSTIDDLRRDVTLALIQEFERLAYDQVEECKRKGEDPPKRKKINAQLVGSVLSLVRSLGSVPSDITYGSMLERDDEGRVIGAGKKNMIAFKNGLLDLDRLLTDGHQEALTEHTSDWWSQAKLPYDFDPTARIGPEWTGFLAKNLAGNEQLIQCLQEWMGYCLLPNTDHHKFLIMIGEGANGKSVFCAVVEALLGEENVSHVPLELFGQRFALQPTLGKLANIATETHDIDRIAEGYLKQFTDGSKMTFDRKGISVLDARPTAKLMIATNQPPRFTDKSMGLWRRMLLAPFTVVIETKEKVLGLDKPDWWLRRQELPGIFNWAIEGLQRLGTQDDFTTAEIADTAKEEYRRETNPAREFLLDTYVAEKGASVATKDVYAAYRKWCETNGYKPLGAALFGKEVRRAFNGIDRRKVSDFRSDLGEPYGIRTWHYAGIRGQIVGDDEEEQKTE